MQEEGYTEVSYVNGISKCQSVLRAACSRCPENEMEQRRGNLFTGGSHKDVQAGEKQGVVLSIT